MKSYILIILITVLRSNSYAQLPEQKHVLPSTDYLKKSKNQKTWAWISTSAGIATIVITSLAEFSSLLEAPYDVESSSKTGYYILGSAFIATGVTLFTISSKNKKKAKTSVLLFKMGKTSMAQSSGIKYKPTPSIGVKITF